MSGQFTSVVSANETTSEWQMLRTQLQRIPRTGLLSFLAAAVALTVYLATIAPDITWANYSSDGGELITASTTLGIAHPPGYPTYILLGKLFSLLPVGTIAFRFNLFSALAMAVAAAFSASTAYAILPRSAGMRWPAALAAALAFAFSPLVWGQATVTEVYALNLALLSIFLWLLLTRRSSWLTGFLLGLAITAHLTSLLMLPIGLALISKGQRRCLLFGLILGLFPVLALPILARLNSPVVWGDPSTLRGWWWLITAQLYRANFSPPSSSQTLLAQLSSSSAVFLSQFAWIGWLFVIVGVIANQLGKQRTRWLLASAALYALFTIAYGTNDAINNFIPALLLLTPLLALGISRLGSWSLLLPIILLLVNFQTQNLRHSQPLRPKVETILRDLPLNALVVTPGDQSIFTLWYFQHVEGRRSDIVLVDENLLAFDWYRERLAAQYPALEGLSSDNRELFRELNSRLQPYCELSLETPQDITCMSWSPSALMAGGEMDSAYLSILTGSRMMKENN